MPRRKFVYGSSGAVDVTPAESVALLDEISADVKERTEPLEFGLPRARCDWKNVATWPVHSDSMACDSAEQAKQEQEYLKKNGVNTDYDAEHRPIWTSRAHKKAYHRALGHADPDAGYGDAEPVKFHSGIKRVDPNQRLEQARQALIEKEYRLFGQRVSDI